MCACVRVCVLNLISLPPLLSATLLTSSAVCHLIVAIVMLIRAPHAGKGNKTGWIALFSIWLSTRRSPPLPPTLPPSSYLPRHLPPSLILSFRPFMCSVIAATIGSFWKTLNYRAAASSAHIHAAETQQQINAGRKSVLFCSEKLRLFRNARRVKKEKAALLFPAREFKMSTSFLICVWIIRLVGVVGVEWAWGSRTGK